MIRLFAALELPGPARAALATWGARVAGRQPAIRLVPVTSLHVTLVFLGSQEDTELDAIVAAMLGSARPVGALRIARAAWLPERRPGVLVADLAAADDGLALLHADLERALAGWHAPETRSFRPHVTVARVRRGERLSQREVAAPPELTFSPTALVLYRSELGGPTPSYEAVGRARLR